MKSIYYTLMMNIFQFLSNKICMSLQFLFERLTDKTHNICMYFAVKVDEIESKEE
jgi:hypothetical protein